MKKKDMANNQNRKEKNITFIKNFIKSNYFPFVLLFVLLLFLHLFMNFGGDDVFFGKQMNSLIHGNYISKRYNTWSSRLIIESILISITGINTNIWRVIDTTIYTISALLIMKIINKDNKTYINWIGCLLFLIYPYADLSSAGWGATTTNYLWCFCFGMISFLPLINRENGKKNSKIIYPISTLSLFYAINQEQMCAIVLGFNILYLANTIYKKEKISKYNIMCLLISVLGLIFIVTCPGNAVRKLAETNNWYPEFSKYGIIQKVYLGIISTASIIVGNKIILFLFSLILAYATLVYSKTNFSKIVAILNFITVSSITIFKSLLLDIFPKINDAFNVLNYQGIPKLADKVSYIPLFITLLLVVSTFYMILVIFKDKHLLPLFIFLAGICSRLIIGFSPTVFASGARTAFFLYMSLISTMIFVINKLYLEKKDTKSIQIIILSVIIFFAVANYINTFIYI